MRIPHHSRSHRAIDFLPPFVRLGCLCLVLCAGIPADVHGSLVQEKRVELTITEGTSIAAALSPDGRTVAFDLLGAIWTVPLEGGTATRVTDDLGDTRQPAWSPDGRRIAFQSYRDGNWHVWTVGVGGGQLRQLTHGPFDDREPDWSHDGTRIAFSSDRAGSYDVWALEIGTGALRRITSATGNEFAPAWSPDNREVAYVSEQQSSRGIWVAVEGGSTRLVASVAGLAAGPSWSPEGTVLVYNLVEGGRSRLVVTDPAREASSARPQPSALSVTAPDEDVFPFRVSWLSDTEFLYTADGKLKRRSLESPRSTVVEFQATVSFVRSAYTRRRRDFDSGDPRPVRGVVAPTVNPAGDDIAFVALGDVWVMSGGRPVRLSDDEFVEMDPAWSPDGSHLVFGSDRAGTMDLWLRDMRTGEERQLTRLPGTETAPAWSPDGARVAFIAGRGEVHAVDVRSGEVTKLHEPLFNPGRPSWSADGRRLALSVLRPYSSRFREGRNEILIMSLGGEADRLVNPLPHRSIGSRGIDGPVWSPDGRQMAFVTEGVLWTVPVDSTGEPIGAATVVANELAGSPSWTGNSRSLVYQATDRLKRVSLDDGNIEEIALNLTWRPRQPSGELIVHAGRVFAGDSETLDRNMDIIVEGNRIREIVPHRRELHGGRVIDATSNTVMPGLIEMHTHQSPAAGEVLGRIWLAYGITTVREPASDAYGALERREAIGAGVRTGPREFFTGGTFDGSRVYYAGTPAMNAGTQVELELERAKMLGYDMIKTYVRLPDNLQERVIAFAHENGMPVSSHELYPAVALGADGVEHIRGTSRRGYSPKVSYLNRTYDDVIQLLAHSGMTITPTIGIMGGFFVLAAKDPSMVNDPRFETLFPATVVERTRTRAEAVRSSLSVRESRLKPFGETVRRVVSAGGRVIAGTDSPIIPQGLSLHTELQHFVDAGLTPFEALQTATSVAAEALGVGDELGSLEPGMLADMVVVEGDPLRDIRDARRVKLVIKNGEVYTLDDLLQRPIP
jgi:Tol biopolymer transport system component/imidazolonepropionase-like amidohydrolase